MNLEANPEEMKSGALHEDPKEDAAVEIGTAPNKWHRGRHLATGHHGQPKERTQGNCGSQKKLATASMTTTHHIRVARCKEHGHQG
jgi:hypothetical protein